MIKSTTHHNASGTTNIVASCHGCASTTTIVVPTDAYKRWRSGTLIQAAFPQLSADTRELLISGTCPECWSKLFDSMED